MLQDLVTGPFAPFTFALLLFGGLLALEILFALVGGTLLALGAEVDAPDINAPDMELPDLSDLNIDLSDVDMAELDLAETSLAAVDVPDQAASPSGWLGFGKMPALIWLASALLSFGTFGVLVQQAAQTMLGGPLPGLAAALPAGAGAVWFTAKFGALFAKLLPKTQTESLSEKHLGRRAGLVTQGTAARGRPAEVRVTDRFGNSHYLRAEPLRDGTTIAQGSEVLVLRHRSQGGYLLVPLTDQ